MNAPLPKNETQRLEALQSYAIFDTAPDSRYDEITALAAEICGVPIAAITLVDQDRQWLKSKVGLAITETSREVAFCAHSLEGAELVLVPDTLLDQRFKDNPMVLGLPGIRFYAGAPLATPEGHTLGTLCVIDLVPRQLSEQQLSALKVLSRHVMTQLELRRRTQEDRRMAALLGEAQNIAKMGSWEMDFATGRLRWSAETCTLFGITRENFGGTMEDFLGFVLPADRPELERTQKLSTETGTLLEAEFRIRRADGEVRWMFERGKVIGDEAGNPVRRLGMVTDITERKRNEHIQACEARVLESISARKPLECVLEKVILGLEDILPGAMCCILLADASGSSLQLGLAPSLPADYLGGLKLEVADGLRMGSCGASVRQKAPVIADDIASHPSWEDQRELALKHGLRACWSMPALDSQGSVLAVFAVYFHEPRSPDPSELGLITRLTHITGIAVERDLKERELHLLETGIERLNDMILITEAFPLDEPGPRIVFVNKAFETFTGYTKAEVLGRSPRLLQGRDTSREELDRIHEALGNNEPVRAEVINYTKAGHAYWIELDMVPVCDADGKATHFVAVQRDVTERKKAERKLQQQAALLDKAQDAILVRDLDHSILYWNRSAERLYGWEAGEVLGKSAKELLYHNQTGFLAATEAVLAKGEWVGEIDQITKEGKELKVEGRWTLVRDDKGAPQSILAINTDITERKKLEAQFLRAQRLESIGTLAGGIAHDLNNMLAPVMISLEVLKMKFPDEETEDLLNILETSAKRGADLVKQVLAFARGVEGERIAVNPVHLMRDIQKIAQDTFPKSVSFNLSAPKDLWTVTGDPTQIHQVFLNLCVNARDAMPNGGQLTVAMENMAVDETYAAMNPDSRSGAYVMIRVTDTGTGIPPAIRDKIFEPFFTTKEVGKGTGLGLSTTLAIVKSHGGFINLYSEIGKGTTFKVYLPANTSEVAADIVALEQTRLPRGNGELVLVVDDEEAIRKVVQGTLERFGYRIMLASHGAEAVALYARHQQKISVVLTDMAMPIMDGPTTIIALRAINPEVKIIGSSGLASNGGVAKALGAGVHHFVPKPYTAEILLKTLSRVLHGWKDSAK